MGDGPDPLTTGPAGRRPLRRFLEAAVVTAFLGFIVWAVVRQWPQVEAVIGQLSASSVGAATVAALVGIWFSFLCWRAILADFGSRIDVPAGMRVFFVGQAGKYVPGKVWPIVTQVRLGRDYQVPGRTSAAAALIFMVVVLGTGLLVAVCCLPVLGSEALGGYWWVLLALPLAALTLWPPVLNRGLGWATRIARREPMPRPVSAAGIARAAGWALLMWAAYGVHLWVLLTALDATTGQLLIRSLGAFAGAWSIGFLLMVAPAGVGPREVALVLLLSTSVAQPVALVAAVVSRLLMTVGDLVWPVVAIAVERHRQRRRRMATAAP